MTGPRFAMILFVLMLVGCGGNGEVSTSNTVMPSQQSFSYKNVSAADIDNIKNLWSHRDLSVKELSLVYEDHQPGYYLRIFKHKVGANVHYGAVVTPDGALTAPLPVMVLADGLNQSDPSITVDDKLLGYKSDAVLVIAAYRGRLLRYKDLTFYAEGDFCDAYDGATDDTIALMNVVAETTPMAKMDAILVSGYSRGGNVALLLSERDARVHTVIAGAGPVDFNRQTVRDLYTTQYNCQFFTNKTAEQSGERILASSPLHFALVPSVKKVYLLHGAADIVVPIWNAKEMNNHLVEQKADVSLYLYDGYGHSDIWSNQNFTNTWTRLHADFVAL